LAFSGLREMLMKSNVACVTLAMILTASVFAVQDEKAKSVKEATGTVKSVSTSTIVVTDSAGKDRTFTIDRDATMFVTEGVHHKISDFNVAGEKATVSNFLSEGNKVSVKYFEKGNGSLATAITTGGGGSLEGDGTEGSKRIAGYPKFFSIQSEKGEIFLSPACVEAAGTWKAHEGPGLVFRDDAARIVALVDIETHPCPKLWAEIATRSALPAPTSKTP
jgi:hypothetical protein